MVIQLIQTRIVEAEVKEALKSKTGTRAKVDAKAKAEVIAKVRAGTRAKLEAAGLKREREKEKKQTHIKWRTVVEEF